MNDDWTPPPGMTKRNCTSCRRDFATRGRVSVCPTCLVNPPKRHPRPSTFDPVVDGGTALAGRLNRRFGDR